GRHRPLRRHHALVRAARPPEPPSARAASPSRGRAQAHASPGRVPAPASGDAAQRPAGAEEWPGRRCADPPLDGRQRGRGVRNPIMKGVILAGGSRTRLHPLTRITNKHLLPIYDRPMVTYAIEALGDAGIQELMLVTGGTHAGEFFRLLGNGHDYGIDRLFYAYQDQAGGIAEALGLAERFVDRDKVCVMLADNIFERSLRPI